MIIKKIPRKSMIINFIMLNITFLILPFSILLLYTLDKTSDFEAKSANQFLSSNLRTISTTIDQVLFHVEKTQLSLILNNSFTTTLQHLSSYDTKDEYQDFMDYKEIRDNILSTASYNDYIYSIYAYSITAQRFFSSTVNWNPKFNHFRLEDIDWYPNSSVNSTERPWVIIHGVEDNRTLLSNIRELRDSYQSKAFGVLSVNVDSSVISELLNEVKMNKYSFSFMSDGAGNMITDDSDKNKNIYKSIYDKIPMTSEKGFFKTSFHGGNYFVSYFTSDYSKFKYVVIVPLEHIETTNSIITVLLIVFIFCTLFTIAISILLAYNYLFKPVRKLFKAMHHVEQGNFKVRLSTGHSYEIEYINHNFNNMVTNIEKLIEENYIARLISKEAQLETIQNQLNEHFLYNTLDVIHWMAKKENALDACDMIYSLANFYRVSLSSGKEYITLQQVIDMLESYLHIQKIRMGEAFEYEIEYDKNILEDIVIKYPFQPLVENAFTHGIRNLDRQGRIHISFQIIDDRIHFSVKDNGIGLDEKQLEQLIQDISSDFSDDNNFALKTINYQLQNLYGKTSCLKILSVLNEGFEISFEIPRDVQGGI